MGGHMANKELTVKELTDALKQFPLDATVYYEMGPMAQQQLGRAIPQRFGKDDEMGVLLDR